MTKLHIVKFSGPFGFIKPWTAVRDEETYSQQFLTPSILEGMEKKLFPELLGSVGLQGTILGHRLSYTGLSSQQEQTWSKAWVKKSETQTVKRLVTPKKSKGLFDEPVYKDLKIKLVNERPATGILKRGVLLEPNLYLAFATPDYAERALGQHLCLCRNEDVLLPEGEVEAMLPSEWAEVVGFELLLTDENEQAFRVGYNRFSAAQPMFGRLISVGDPIRKFAEE
jgi:hypothetical protein